MCIYTSTRFLYEGLLRILFEGTGWFASLSALLNGKSQQCSTRFHFKTPLLSEVPDVSAHLHSTANSLYANRLKFKKKNQIITHHILCIAIVNAINGPWEMFFSSLCHHVACSALQERRCTKNNYIFGAGLI